MFLGLTTWIYEVLSSSTIIKLTRRLLQGMQSARGAVLLFADADGATKFSDLTKLEDSLRELVKGYLPHIIIEILTFTVVK